MARRSAIFSSAVGTDFLHCLLCGSGNHRGANAAGQWQRTGAIVVFVIVVLAGLRVCSARASALPCRAGGRVVEMELVERVASPADAC
jgi:hypothetical protein